MTTSSLRKDQCYPKLVEDWLCTDLAPLYQDLCEDLGWSQDAARLQKMQQANEARLKELEEKIKDAEENLGDIEVRDASLAKADHLCQIGA